MDERIERGTRLAVKWAVDFIVCDGLTPTQALDEASKRLGVPYDRHEAEAELRKRGFREQRMTLRVAEGIARNTDDDRDWARVENLREKGE